ncbi:MAG: hypothetical protein AB7I27_13155 [Bacteriovoracaceae bacterium]
MWWIFLLPTLLFAAESADEKVVGVFYFTPLFGHVHQSPSKMSASLTTIQCAHPVKVLQSSKVSTSQEWSYVEVADYHGFIQKRFLEKTRPDCFLAEYPKFFDALNLDLSELYYWGRLYDHYIQGESRVH